MSDDVATLLAERLLVRFAIAFGAASRELRRQWRRDDRGRARVEGDAAVSRDTPLIGG